jgi:nicotinamidase-related amidase
VYALLVIDMQRGLVADPEAVVGAAALTKRIEELIRRATDDGAPVVQLQNDGAAGQVDEPGQPDWELALTGGTVVRKNTDDGFADSAPCSTSAGAPRRRRRRAARDVRERDDAQRAGPRAGRRPPARRPRHV